MKKYFWIIALFLLTPSLLFGATTVPLGKDGGSQYLLYPTDTFSAHTLHATGTNVTSTFGGNLSVDGTGTSTSAGGWDISAGCFAILGACIGGDSHTGTGFLDRVAFWISPTELSYDDLFPWDNTNKRLGIGTSTPKEGLHLEGKNGLITPLASSTAAIELVKTVVLSDISNALPQGICVQGNYLYMGTSADNKLRVFDITDPKATAQISAVTLPTGAVRQIFCKGRYLIAADEATTRNIVSVDISDPHNPTIVKQVAFSDTSGVYKYSSQGNYLYGFNGTSNRMKIIDISDPLNVELVSTTNLSAAFGGTQSAPFGRFLAVYDQRAASLEQLDIWDVIDPSRPIQVGTLALNGAGGAAATGGLKASGRYVHLVTQTDDLYRIIDVSDPTTPVVVGSTSVDDGTNSMDLAGRYTYLTSATLDTIQIVDTASTTAPYKLVSFDNPQLSNSGFLSAQGRYLYDPNSGPGLDELRIFEIPNFEAPSAEIGLITAQKINLLGDFTGSGSLTISGGIQSGLSGLISNGPGTFYNAATSTALSGVEALKAFTVDGNGSSIVDVFSLTHLATSTTPANGVGTGILFGTSLDSQAGTTTARIASLLTDVTAATPASALSFYTKSGVGNVAERVRIDSNGRLGIGTTTPGTDLSIGNTGDSTINISKSATSTFGFGIDLRDGCFSIDSVCIGGSGLTGSGSANRATFWTSASNLSFDNDFVWDNTLKNLGLGTTSPYARLSVVGETVMEYFHATSSTATSTIAGHLDVNGRFELNNEFFTDLTGTGLQNSAGSLSLNLLTPTTLDSDYTESTSVSTAATSTLATTGSISPANATVDMHIRGHVTLVSESNTDGIIALAIHGNNSCTAGPMRAYKQFPVTLASGLTVGTVEISYVEQNTGDRYVLCARAITQGHAARAAQIHALIIDNGN